MMWEEREDERGELGRWNLQRRFRGLSEMQELAPQLRAALPSLVPLPEFKCLNPRDRLWEIKANSF